MVINRSVINLSQTKFMFSANGTTNSSLTSSSNSRRNSCGTVPKCDNITKYPNKKQIEDKLNQIRDYLNITTSLMSGMKNSDDQVIF